MVLALGLLAGCGGDDEVADSSTDVDQLLDETFSGGKSIESGRIDLALGIEPEAGQPVSLKVTGPFQSEGEGRLPQLDIDASFEGAGQSIEGGVTATADQAFVSFGGTDYEIAGPVFEQFKAGYEETAKQSSGRQDQSLASLGIDPRRWLTNAENAGEAKVGDTDTIKITGDVDVPKLLEDVDAALEKLRSLGIQGSDQLPERLTDEEKRQAAEAIENLDVEIYTGADDRILRRIVIALGLSAEGSGAADVRFDLQLLDVNEDQEIEAPEGAKPFDDLVAQLRGLGLDLGNLGDLGALGAGGSGAGGGSASPDNLEKYADCLRAAGNDNDEVRKCADLLTTP